MNFLYAAGSLTEGERLGLAISVEKNGTNPGDGLEVVSTIRASTAGFR